jgi:hypothetical protein
LAISGERCRQSAKAAHFGRTKPTQNKKINEFNASHPECIARDEQRAGCNTNLHGAGEDAKPFIEERGRPFWPNEANNPGNLS